MTPSEIMILLIGTTGVGGFFLGIYNAYVGARKGTIDEWRGLLEEQRKLIDELKKKLEERDEEIEELKDWCVRLVSQIRSLGREPEMFKPIQKISNQADK